MITNKINDFQIRQVLTVEEAEKILFDFDSVFKPTLSERNLDFLSFATKLIDNAIVLIAYEKDILGFTAFYANDNLTGITYISQTAVKPEYQGKGIAQLLIDKTIEISKEKKMNKVKLQVLKSNIASIKFHEKNGFEHVSDADNQSMYMVKELN